MIRFLEGKLVRITVTNSVDFCNEFTAKLLEAQGQWIEVEDLDGESLFLNRDSVLSVRRVTQTITESEVNAS